MTPARMQYFYKLGFDALGMNPFNPKSPAQRIKYYLFNAGQVDRLNGYEYDAEAFL